jgi:hypothetical protein
LSRGKYGNLLGITSINSLLASADDLDDDLDDVLFTVSSNKGTKEDLVCNGHGICDGT